MLYIISGLETASSIHWADSSLGQMKEQTAWQDSMRKEKCDQYFRHWQTKGLISYKKKQSLGALGSRFPGSQSLWKGWRLERAWGLGATKTGHVLLCTAALGGAWNITGTRHVYRRNTRAESSLPGVERPLYDSPLGIWELQSLLQILPWSRQEQSQQSINFIHDSGTPVRNQRRPSLFF